MSDWKHRLARGLEPHLRLHDPRKAISAYDNMPYAIFYFVRDGRSDSLANETSLGIEVGSGGSTWPPAIHQQLAALCQQAGRDVRPLRTYTRRTLTVIKAPILSRRRRIVPAVARSRTVFGSARVRKRSSSK